MLQRLASAPLELEEVVTRRRMCRHFQDRPVEPGAIDRALAIALKSPSAGHTQGWAFVVLEGGQTELFWQHQADPQWRQHPDHPGLLVAPVIVLPLASEALYAERYREPDKAGRGQAAFSRWQVPYWLVDTAFATMAFLLGLTSEGLGALFFALHQPPEPLLADLGVPPGWQPLGAIAVGWPSPSDARSQSVQRGRRPWEEVVHRGRWCSS